MPFPLTNVSNFVAIRALTIGSIGMVLPMLIQTSWSQLLVYYNNRIYNQLHYEEN